MVHKIKNEYHDLQVVDQSVSVIVIQSLLLSIALILAINNIGKVTVLSVWLVLSIILVSELINTVLVRRNYYNKKIFTYYHRKFSYQDVVEMKTNKSFFLANSFEIVTKDGSNFNVTKEYYEIISNQLGK